MQKKTAIHSIIVALIMMFCTSAYAQFPNHAKGDFIIKESVGLPFTSGTKFLKAPDQSYKNLGLSMYIQQSFDYAISNKMDIGLFGGYGAQNVDVITSGSKSNGISSVYVGGGARLIYHIWGKARIKWDPYVLIGGGVLSATHVVETGENDAFGEPGIGIMYTARVGMNYYFTPTFGLHAEGGYGISYGTLGMQLRF